MNVDTLVDYIFRVFGNVLTRTEFSEANQNTGNIALRLFNEHCEDAYLANIDLIRAGRFEDDFAFTYVFIRGPVSVTLSRADIPGYKVVLSAEGGIRSDSVASDPESGLLSSAEITRRYYMERVGETSVVAVPRDADFVIEWEAQDSGTVETCIADCSVHASARYEGAVSPSQRVRKGDTGIAYRSETGGVPLDGFEPKAFTASEIASFMGIDSVGVNWRVSLMLFAALAGLVITILIWFFLLLSRTRKKPGVPVWLCLCIFCIAMLEAELAFWFFADHTNLRMLWKIILGVSLLIIFLIRHWRSKRTLLMLPGFFMLIAADVVMCLYFLQGAILFMAAHVLLIVAFLYRSPMPLKMWIQWFVVSAIASVLIVSGFIRKIGLLAWGAAAYAVILLLMNYAAGGQLPRVRFAARLFLLSEAILLIFMTVFDEPILHILSVLMFDIGLLMIAVSKVGVEQPQETAPEPPSPEPEESAVPEEVPAPEAN